MVLFRHSSNSKPLSSLHEEITVFGTYEYSTMYDNFSIGYCYKITTFGIIRLVGIPTTLNFHTLIHSTINENIECFDWHMDTYTFSLVPIVCLILKV